MTLPFSPEAFGASNAGIDRSGSADVLEAVGVPLDLSPRGVEQCIEKAGIGFMFAPSHHPSMKRVQPVRRSLKIRTVFNMMGPLLNPAKARRAIIGVYAPSILELMASVLLELGTPPTTSTSSHAIRTRL